MGALLVGALVATVFIRNNNVRRAQMILGFLAASLVANVIRVVCLASLAGVGSEELALSGHDPVGYVLFVVLHAGLVWAAWRLQKTSGA